MRMHMTPGKAIDRKVDTPWHLAKTGIVVVRYSYTVDEEGRSNVPRLFESLKNAFGRTFFPGGSEVAMKNSFKDHKPATDPATVSRA